MATVINTTFQVKRGLSTRWEIKNPVLASGEPGYELDTHKLKIGDGSTRWLDLPYVGENLAVISSATHYDFPSIGKNNVIYKAETEKKIYQWNDDTLVYEVIGNVELDIGDIEIINGGSANG